MKPMTIIAICVICAATLMSGCVAPEGTWDFDGTLKHVDDENESTPSYTPTPIRPQPTPTPDPCIGVICSPECYGVDLYRTNCVDGICIRGDLLEEDSLRCGYVIPTPTPTPSPTVTPDPCAGVVCGTKCVGANLYGTTCQNGECVTQRIVERNSARCGFVNPTPKPTVTPTPEPTPAPIFGSPVIVIDPPVYSGVVRNNGEILDITVTPNPLIAGDKINIQIDILNTGTVTSWFEIHCDNREGERRVYSGDTASATFTNNIDRSGDYTWDIELYWDAEWPASNVLLQTASVGVHYYTQYEVDNM